MKKYHRSHALPTLRCASYLCARRRPPQRRSSWTGTCWGSQTGPVNSWSSWSLGAKGWGRTRWLLSLMSSGPKGSPILCYLPGTPRNSPTKSTTGLQDHLYCERAGHWNQKNKFTKQACTALPRMQTNQEHLCNQWQELSDKSIKPLGQSAHSEKWPVTSLCERLHGGTRKHGINPCQSLLVRMESGLRRRLTPEFIFRTSSLVIAASKMWRNFSWENSRRMRSPKKKVHLMTQLVGSQSILFFSGG